jgi:hypothetical protein
VVVAADEPGVRAVAGGTGLELLWVSVLGRDVIGRLPGRAPVASLTGTAPDAADRAAAASPPSGRSRNDGSGPGHGTGDDRTDRRPDTATTAGVFPPEPTP